MEFAGPRPHNRLVSSYKLEEPPTSETLPSLEAARTRNFPSGITEIAPKASDRDPRQDVEADGAARQVARIPLASRIAPAGSSTTQQSLEAPQSDAAPSSGAEVSVEVVVKSAPLDDDDDLDFDVVFEPDPADPSGVPTEATSPAQRYLALARRSFTDGDPVAAANALRVACGLSEAITPAAQAADLAQRDGRVHQAQSAEKDGLWDEAAVTYARAARSHTDGAFLLERAAFCRVRSGTSPRGAVDLAQRAVWLEPRDATFRATLAEAYAAAGRFDQALSEVEKAIGLAPDLDAAQDTERADLATERPAPD